MRWQGGSEGGLGKNSVGRAGSRVEGVSMAADFCCVRRVKNALGIYRPRADRGRRRVVVDQHLHSDAGSIKTILNVVVVVAVAIWVLQAVGMWGRVTSYRFMH